MKKYHVRMKRYCTRAHLLAANGLAVVLDHFKPAIVENVEQNEVNVLFGKLDHIRLQWQHPMRALHLKMKLWVLRTPWVEEKA